jgi:hypothetical protein
VNHVQEYAVPAVPTVSEASAHAHLALQGVEINSSDVQEQAWQTLPAADSVNDLGPGQTTSVQVAVTTEQLKVISNAATPDVVVFVEVCSCHLRSLRRGGPTGCHESCLPPRL